MSEKTYSQNFVIEESEKFFNSQALNKTWAEISVSVIATLNDIDVDNNKNYEFKLILRKLDRRTLMALGLISWYLPEELRFLLQLELSKIQSREDLGELRFILNSKSHSLIYIRENLQLKGPEHLFGNILDKNFYKTLGKAIKFSRKDKNRGPKIPESRRIGVGYRDKGNLPDIAKGGAIGKLSLSSKQNEIEDKRKSDRDLASFLEGFLL